MQGRIQCGGTGVQTSTPMHNIEPTNQKKISTMNEEEGEEKEKEEEEKERREEEEGKNKLL
jgi:hypothetical protein